jgi:hypothetical protein
MKLQITSRRRESGEIKWGVLLWALGVPLPIVLLVVLLRGCA